MNYLSGGIIYSPIQLVPARIGNDLVSYISIIIKQLPILVISVKLKIILVICNESIVQNAVNQPK